VRLLRRDLELIYVNKAEPIQETFQSIGTTTQPIQVVQKYYLACFGSLNQESVFPIKKALGVTREAELAYWQVLARVLRLGSSLLAMVHLATTCAAAALLGWRRAFTEDDLYANGSWLEGRHPSSNAVSGKPAPPNPKTNSFATRRWGFDSPRLHQCIVFVINDLCKRFASVGGSKLHQKRCHLRKRFLPLDPLFQNEMFKLRKDSFRVERDIALSLARVTHPRVFSSVAMFP
jgi:hypothetical protein